MVVVQATTVMVVVPWVLRVIVYPVPVLSEGVTQLVDPQMGIIRPPYVWSILIKNCIPSLIS